MRITIETIPHENQRYPTAGDWLWPNEHNLLIRVSEMGDWRKEAAVAVHELVEAILCKADGVAEDAVDAFDRAYEADRTSLDDSEPGDDPTAPYHRQHCFATAVERMLIAALGVPWSEYDAAVEAL
jgi:hypothetical protein